MNENIFKQITCARRNNQLLWLESNGWYFSLLNIDGWHLPSMLPVGYLESEIHDYKWFSGDEKLRTVKKQAGDDVSHLGTWRLGLSLSLSASPSHSSSATKFCNGAVFFNLFFAPWWLRVPFVLSGVAQFLVKLQNFGYWIATELGFSCAVIEFVIRLGLLNCPYPC